HDDADHAEENLGHGVDDAVDALTQVSQVRNGKAGENRDQQDLQQVAVGEGAHEGVGNDRQQVGDDTLLLGAVDVAFDRAGIERGRVDVEAFARLQKFADQEPDRQRHRRHRLEIEQRLDADPADLLEVAHRADAVHYRAEDHRADHHFDERDEAVAERFEGDAEVRKVMADQDAGGDGKQNLNVENGVPGTPRRGHGSSLPPRGKEVAELGIKFFGRLVRK